MENAIQAIEESTRTGRSVHVTLPAAEVDALCAASSWVDQTTTPGLIRVSGLFCNWPWVVWARVSP